MTTKATVDWLQDIASNIPTASQREDYLNLYISYIYEELDIITARTEQELDTYEYEERLRKEAKYLQEQHVLQMRKVQERLDNIRNGIETADIEPETSAIPAKRADKLRKELARRQRDERTKAIWNVKTELAREDPSGTM